MPVRAAIYRRGMLKRFDAHETERMKQLEGLPLASFGSRALRHERLSFWHSLGGFGFIQYCPPQSSDVSPSVR